VNEAVLSIENSLFSDNSAGKGGAIFNKTLGTITITNSTLSGNTSGVEHGGGLFNAGDAYLTNVTVTDNTAQNSGGGIYVDPIAETVTQLSNTLVSNNIANGPVDISGQVTSPDGGNLVRDTNGVTGLHIDDITDENPFLSSLVDNGGSTPTHALLAESAAINSGVKSVAPLHDQRGVARDDQLPDIGAYEVANEASFKSLWLTTDGDVSSSSTMGINSWGKDTVAEFGNPNLNLGSNTTIGTFSEVVDFQIDNTGINALHYVGSEIVVGDDSFMILQKGDLILSVGKNGATLTSTNSIEVDRDDIFVFRPDVIGDYSQGTFILLLDGDQVSGSINSITLIEERTDVGGKVLEKGSFLATYDSEVPSDNVYLLEVTGVGEGTSSAVRMPFIDGSDIGTSTQIVGIDVIEASTIIGGVALESGQVLLSFSDEENSIGDNMLSSTASQDIVVLDYSITSTGEYTVSANILFDGSDVGLEKIRDNVNGFTLRPDTSSTEQILNKNRALSVVEASRDNVVTTATLETTDVDNTTEQIVYTVTAIPLEGDLKLNETILDVSNTFTQDDIDRYLL